MTTAAEPGVDIDVTIDGVSVVLPATLECRDTLAHALTATSCRPRLDAWRYGDGLPNLADIWEWKLSYHIDDNYAATNVFLERLRTKGGVRTFADWKGKTYTYTARSGQQLFYLPRQDAFSKGYAGHTADRYKAKATRITALGAESTLTVVYKSMVSGGDVVPAGEVWISNTTLMHPEAGLTVAPFKVGTALAIFDEIVIEFCPLYRVGVMEIPTEPFEMVGREDKALLLAEVA